jgi:hypothetical protein
MNDLFKSSYTNSYLSDFFFCAVSRIKITALNLEFKILGTSHVLDSSPRYPNRIF